MNARTQRGFTLVEVVVAVTLIALLLSTVYGVFSSVSGARQRLEAESEGYHEARVLFDRLGRELRGAYFNAGKPATRLIGGKTLDDRPHLELTTTAVTPYAGLRGGISVVRYELLPDPEAEDKGTRVLMRNEYSLFDPDGADREGYRLASGIGDMTVRFYKGGQWHEQWNARSSGPPEIVEITLSLPVRGVLVPFRTAFDIPLASGRLPLLGGFTGTGSEGEGKP